MSTTVVNIRDLPLGPLPEGHVYIGRAVPGRGLPPSRWGNPYRVGPMSREDAIAAFEVYLLGRRELLRRVGELRGKTLVCWCAPEACHGDVLAAMADAS